ncbi:hypothetical protein KAJ89_05990, partial [Candidatus Parcubacteria bacterium]|nr:hypothetical protein [Candidatus Parcubacteria bacterium]
FMMIVMSFLYVANLNPIDISVFLGAKMGSAIGMNISVPENPFNKLAFQLDEKEARLNEQEKKLDERADALGVGDNIGLWLMIIAFGIGVLFVLILFNFYLDIKRRRLKEKQ